MKKEFLKNISLFVVIILLIESLSGYIVFEARAFLLQLSRTRFSQESRFEFTSN